MNEVTKEGYSAIEQALRDEAIPPRVVPKKFERRDTVALPTTTALTPEGRAEERRGFAHSRPTPLDIVDDQPAVYVKPDQGKLRWDLLPQDALEQVVGVLTVDADTRNRDWELGCEWRRPLASAHRHLNAWARGEQMDKGTKCPHLACAIAQLMFLLAYEQRGAGVDDRSKNETKPT